MFRVTTSTAEMAEQLAAIQRASFPTMSAAELIRAEHYRAHVEVFPEGQHAVLNERDEVVACSTDFRGNIDLDHFEHRYLDAVAANWLSNHDPEGDWLYGADIGVHPDYRGLGLSKRLYAVRHDLVRRLNLRGHVAGSMLVGYGAVRDRLSPQAYVEQVVSGERFDPTLSIQLRRGFEVLGIIEHYVEDSSCANKAAFIVWRNPDYRASSLRLKEGAHAH